MEYTGPISPTLASRFASNLSPGENGCVNWTGAKTNGGYGMISIYTGIARSTHQVAWFIKHGKWPEKLLMHSCDNRACCNIDHLSEGTYRDNSMDASRKGRMVMGEKHHNSRMTSDQVDEMRMLRGQGWGIIRLAKKFSTSGATVSKICRCEIRNHG